MRRSSPLKFISLLHVSILKDHHQGVNVPIYEVIECFLFLLILLVWWRHACRCVGYVMLCYVWLVRPLPVLSERTGNGLTSQT